MPPGRPIISDCSSKAYTVEEYIDHFLLLLASGHASYVKDTTKFLSKLKSVRTKPDSLHMDSMCTHIDNEDGLEAVKKAFISQPDSTDLMSTFANYWKLDEKTMILNSTGRFLQISGTAVRKKFALSYANIFMSDWEESALEKCYQKPSFYLWYLDNILLIWDHGEANVRTFLEILSNHQPAIKLNNGHPSALAQS